VSAVVLHLVGWLTMRTRLGAGSEENKFGGEAGFEEGLGSSWCAEMA
jgi:hypothetical protein